jgi:hypothetical protein
MDECISRVGLRGTHVAYRPRLAQALNPTLLDQYGQSALQGAARQAVALRLGDGIYAQAIGLRSNQLNQLIKLGLGSDSRHVLSFLGGNGDSIAPLKVAHKDYCDK